jgi:hypothetical protein
LKKGKYGRVYLPVEKVVEGKPKAPRDKVLRLIREIDAAANSNNWNTYHLWIKELRQLCIHNRTGGITELLDAINRYVNTPELFENEEVREDLAETMSYIVNNEKTSGEVKTTNEVITKLVNSARNIALYDRKTGCYHALYFLSETEDKQSVDVIMTVISQVSEEAEHRQIMGNFEDSIHRILFDSELAKQQSGYIQQKLVELSGSENEAVRSFIRRLQEKPRFRS